ncbi:peptidoglycan DD-metalloendopeptidase family protein [Pokkaliibacter sp. CJK22405]|uniref:peptidoglycan DD-metalloendopeptidase family protein n=1 Tax=Pokkaliibacter sp. CJK22405 TaxID=3384615 RepID=UPI0039847CB8
MLFLTTNFYAFSVSSILFSVSHRLMVFYKILSRLPKLHVAAIFMVGTVVGALIFVPSENVSATRSPDAEKNSISLNLGQSPSDSNDSVVTSSSDSDAELGSIPLEINMNTQVAQSNDSSDASESADPSVNMTLFTPDQNVDESQDDSNEDYGSDADDLSAEIAKSQNDIEDLTPQEQKALENEGKIEEPTATEVASDDDMSLAKEGSKVVTVESGDNLTSVFQRAGFTIAKAIEVDNAFKKERPFRNLHPGDVFTFESNDGSDLQKLQYKRGVFSTVVVEHTDKGYTLTQEVTAPTIKERMVKMTVKDSLFNASKEAGVPYRLIANMSTLFTNDIDFRSDVRKGDTFTLIFEEKYIKNRLVGMGDILAARYTNAGKSFYAIRYEDKTGDVHYYDENGEGKQKAFDRTPVPGARISSPFSPRRYHPKLHRWRAHEGVDLAAPYGTPIHATGYGKVIFKGVKGGYGNVVVLAHSNGISTLYAHMKGFAAGLNKGDKVKRGQVIGYIGTTGLSTGPHVHYEVRLNNVHKDPMKVALPKSDSLTGRAKTAFMGSAKKIVAAMNGKTPLNVALNDK